jgi:hypothetical protein
VRGIKILFEEATLDNIGHFVRISLKTGNLALWDQRAALVGVQYNNEHFERI